MSAMSPIIQQNFFPPGDLAAKQLSFWCGREAVWPDHNNSGHNNSSPTQCHSLLANPLNLTCVVCAEHCCETVCVGLCMLWATSSGPWAR